MIKRWILLVAILALGAQVKASHVLGAYFEYSVDSAQQYLDLRLHIILDSTGIPFTSNTLQALGPSNITLTATGNTPQYFPIGEENCTGRAYYEKIFAGSLSLSRTEMQTVGRKIFSVRLACCIAPMENVDATTNNSNIYLEFSIWPQLDANGSLYYPEFRNIGLNPKMIQNAFPERRNYIDFGLDSVPHGADSSYHKLLDAQREANTSMPYNPGYSGLTPLPDKSEDSLNGNILYYPEQRIISSKARLGSYNPGLYLLRFRNQYFHNIAPYIVDDCLPMVYYLGQDSTLSDSLVTTVAQGNNTLGQVSWNQQFTFPVRFQENLNIDLSATAALGDSIFLFDAELLTDTSHLNLPSNANYALPQLSSLNANGAWDALDTNRLRLRFSPLQDNFVQGPQRISYLLRFANRRCEGFRNSILIHFDLAEQAFLDVLQSSEQDTLMYCKNTSPFVSMINANSGSYWSPGNLVADSTRSPINLIAQNDDWLYLRDSNDLAQDSLYLIVEEPNPLLTLQRGAFESLFQNSNRLSENQYWNVSNVITVRPQQDDILPILGAGTYHVYSEYEGFLCPDQTDTLEIEEDFLWGSSHGKDQQYIDGVINQQSGGDLFRCRLAMPNEARFFERISFYGFENTSTQSRNIEMTLTTSYGYQKTMTFQVNPGGKGFVEMPVNFDLGPGLYADLEVKIDSGLAYQHLAYNQSAFTRNALRFSNFRSGLNGAGLATTGHRLPLGFHYKGRVGLAESKIKPLAVYPNPSKGSLVINLALPGASRLQVHDLNGALVKELELEKGSNQIDLKVPSGLYLLSLPDHPQVKRYKLLID